LFVRHSNSGGSALASMPSLVAALCFLTSVSVLFNPLPLPAQNQANSEYRTKANYIAKFPSFVEWPPDAISPGQASFLICVLGDYPFGISLSELTGGRTFRNHRFEVRWLHNPLESRPCHLLFIGKSERKRYTQLLDNVRGQMVLTVGETPEFLDAGGIIAFSMPGETLQFDVNLAAANKAHLRISSQLLTLARHVLNPTEAAKS
jgi:hypothetical protein